jgi:hypothetical protein
MKLSSLSDESTYQNKAIKPNQHQVTNNRPTARKKRKNQNHRKNQERELKQELTSQSVESAQPSAQRSPEHNTGNADSKRARLAAEQQPAG